MQTKKIYLWWLVLLPAITVTAQQQPCNKQFTGKITDESGEPLIGATIMVNPGEHGKIADEEGRFVFDDLCSGNYDVSVQYLGFKTVAFQITLKDHVDKEVRLEQDISTLKEVTVEDKAIQLGHAQNYTSLNAKDLEASAGKSLGETLKEVPGVNTIQAGPGIFKPVIHGVHSQRVLILNYGIRQEGQQWGAEHAPEIDPFIASNITVIKDASAIKYGTDALGGVVVVNPPPLPEKNVLGGSFNTVLQSNGRTGTVSGMLEGGLKNHDGWGWRVQGTIKRAGDYHTPDYNLTNTGVKETDFSAATGYHRQNFGAEVFFSHFQSELGILKGTAISTLDDLLTAMESETPQYTTDFSYSISEPRQEVSHNLLKLNAHMQTLNGEWRLQYGFQNDNRREFDIRRGSLSSIPSINLQLNTHTADVEWESRNSARRSLCFGLSGMAQQNKNIPGTQRIPFIPNFANISGGAFGVSKWQYESWGLDLGVRYDYRYYEVAGYDYKNTLYKDYLEFHNVSASAGATFQLKNNQSLAVNISSAWRPPHVAELYSLGTHQSAAAIEYGLLLNDSTNEIMNIKDVSFKNEQALKWVMTYHYEKDRISFEASPFVNYIFNYIYLRPKGITQNIRGVYPYFRYTQTDALFTGVDLSANWKVGTHLRLLPKVSLLRASDERNHDYLISIPSNRYEFGVRFEKPERFPLKDFFVESNIKYTARQNRTPRIITVREINEARNNGEDPLNGNPANFDFMAPPDGYFLWKMSTGFTVKSKNLTYDFRLSAENILNTSYREYTNRFRYYADDLGRNFTFSVRCVF